MTYGPTRFVNSATLSEFSVRETMNEMIKFSKAAFGKQDRRAP